MTGDANVIELPTQIKHGVRILVFGRLLVRPLAVRDGMSVRFNGEQAKQQAS